jgi:hypothetical protein
VKESEVSFWYIANKLGPRFRQSAERRLRGVEACGPGVWRGAVLDYPCLLVSTADLPVDEDSFPLHVLGIEPREKQQQVGRFMTEDQRRLEAYSGVFATLHPKVWQEVEAMARSKREKFRMDIRPAVETIGLGEAIEQIGEKQIIEQIGKKKVLAQLDVEDILANLPPAKRRELQRRLQAEAPSSS